MKRLNYYQVHKNKKSRIKIPKFWKQDERLTEMFNDFVRLINEYNQRKINEEM